MVFPVEQQADFFRALTTRFSEVKAIFESLRVEDAQASVEADKWMVWREIQKECGPRLEVESICAALGLDVRDKVRGVCVGLLSPKLVDLVAWEWGSLVV